MTLTVKEIENLLKQESLEDDFLRMIKSDNRVSVKKALEKWEKNKQKLILEEQRIAKLYDYENEFKQEGIEIVAGVDEAGRGPLVGPVSVAAVILSEFKNEKTKQKYGFALNPLWQTAIKLVVIIGIEFFVFYKLASYNGIPFQLLIMGVLVAIYHFITSKTVAGRQIYALGGNAKAAKLSGINTQKVFFWVYTNMGILSAVAGIVLCARNGSSIPKAGDGFEMDAIASCYIGGAATAGGVGTIIGAVVGAFIMGILNNGMSLYGWSTDIQKIVKGAVLLGAVTVDLLSKRKKG